MAPFFSIILPTYNRACRLPTAINSVLSQTFVDFELIIVDDGSTDHTKETVQGFDDKRIVYIYQDNAERSAARNNGIRHAKGEYICFLDSDDCYLANHLQILRDEISKRIEEVALFYTGMLMITESTGVAKGVPMLYEQKLSPVLFVWNHFLLINSVCVHRKILENNLFDPRFNIWEDTHLWLRITSQYPFYQIPVYTTLAIEHTDGSVVQNFVQVNMTAINTYINAIFDLFQNYQHLIAPHITSTMRDQYALSKLYMFQSFAYSNRQYNVVVQIQKRAYEIHKRKMRYLKDRCILVVRRLTRSIG